MGALVVAVPAAATTVILPHDEALADRAHLAVMATVVARDTVRQAEPAVEYRLGDVDVVFGEMVRHELRLRLPGGIAPSGHGLALAGVPNLEVGDRVLSFLTPRGDGSHAPVDLMLGVFRITTIGEREIAYRDLSGVRLLPRADGGGTADAPRDLAHFRRWLVDHARGVAGPKDYFVTAPEGSPSHATADPAGQSPAGLVNKFSLAGSSTLPTPLGCGAEGGQNIRWPVFDQGGTVSWRRHADGLPGFADGGEAAFTEALAAWTATGSAVNLRDGGSSDATMGLLGPDSISTLLFEDPNDSLPGTFEGSGLLALGGAWLDCDTTVAWGGLGFHPILEGDIVIQDGVDRFFAASNAPEAAARELFAHELGHTLGFAHSDDPQALMYRLIHDDGRGALLGEDDLTGLSVLYPATDGNQPPPGEPPLTPTSVVALLSETGANIGWRLSDITAAVRIERRVGDGAFTLRATVGAVEIFHDPDLLPGTTYTYRLQAFNVHGSSPYSGEFAVTTDGTIVPARPSNLRFAPLTTSNLQLSWQDNAQDELFYRVETRIGGTWERLPQVLPADATSVVIGGLEGGLIYRFRVRAVGVFGDSQSSNTALSSVFDPGTACTVTDTRLCLLSGRFAVTVRFSNPNQGGAINAARAVSETDKTGRMWFFNAANTELIVKMIDGSTANGHAWLFYGGLSDLEYWIDVLDTETGATRRYHNPAGELCGLADTRAFPTPAPTSTGASSSSAVSRPANRPDAPPEASAATSPPDLLAIALWPQNALWPQDTVREITSLPSVAPSSAGDPCVPDDETLCLLDGRFAVRVDFVNQHNGDTPGVGKTITGGNKTGFFYFFNLLNTELVVKMLDGRNNNDHFWLFYGGLSDVGFTITVTDTATGEQRQFFNPPGEVCGGKDTRAFFEVPEGSAPNPELLVP